MSKRVEIPGESVVASVQRLVDEREQLKEKIRILSQQNDELRIDQAFMNNRNARQEELARKYETQCEEIQQENRSLRDEKLCLVCVSAKKSVVVTPCNHIPYCNDCWRDAKCDKSRCPLCRTEIMGHFQNIRVD